MADISGENNGKNKVLGHIVFEKNYYCKITLKGQIHLWNT